MSAKMIVLSAVMVGMMVQAIASAASNSSSQYCTFGEKLYRKITVSGNKATAEFDIPAKCAGKAYEYSLVVYTAPNATMRPFSAQKMYSASPVTVFGQGRHTLTSNMPSCGFYQIDLL